MEENWEEDVEVAAENAQPETTCDIPEIKLFGKWPSDDVQVNDISLTVSEFILVFYIFVISM